MKKLLSISILVIICYSCKKEYYTVEYRCNGGRVEISKPEKLKAKDDKDAISQTKALIDAIGLADQKANINNSKLIKLDLLNSNKQFVEAIDKGYAYTPEFNEGSPCFYITE